MRIEPRAKNPVVLSYLALRRAVGYVAFGLPFALVIFFSLLPGHVLQTSISSYYYTGGRNLFVGSLCAIAMFMLCSRGYDRKDEVAGILSAAFAIGVAFFPTTPDQNATAAQKKMGDVHYTCAALLFLTLAYFCLVLFKTTAENRVLTRQKLQRNLVYTICGYAILASIAAIVILKWQHVVYLGKLGSVFFFETTSLLAFGTAWMVKGETFLKDEAPTGAGGPLVTRTAADRAVVGHTG